MKRVIFFAKRSSGKRRKKSLWSLRAEARIPRCGARDGPRIERIIQLRHDRDPRHNRALLQLTRLDANGMAQNHVNRIGAHFRLRRRYQFILK